MVNSSDDVYLEVRRKSITILGLLFYLFDNSDKNTKMSEKMDARYFLFTLNHSYNYFFYLLPCLNLDWFPNIYFLVFFFIPFACLSYRQWYATGCNSSHSTVF